MGSNTIPVYLIKKGFYFTLDPDANVSVVYAVSKGDDIQAACPPSPNVNVWDWS